MILQNYPGDGETKPCAPEFARADLVGTPESVEDMRKLLGTNPNPGVANGENRRAIFRAEASGKSTYPLACT